MGSKKKRSNEHFALLPVTVLESAACATLPLAAFKVLAVLASGYSGKNNGTLSCTESWARKYGIAGTDTVRRSLQELEARELIETTRRGIKMRKMPTLYALTWQPLHNRDGQPLKQPSPPSHRYLKYDGHTWHVPEKNPDKKHRPPGRWIEKNSHPSGGGSVTPMVGVQTPELTPIHDENRARLTPTSGDTLDSGPGPGVSRSLSCSKSQSAHPPSPAPIRESSSRHVRIAGSAPADIVRELLSSGWSDVQVHDFACKQKLSITLDEIKAISARPHA